MKLTEKECKALTQIVTCYVVPGKVPSTDVVKLKSATVVDSKSVSISADSRVKANKASVIKAYILTFNGVRHFIDTVLMPKR